MSVLCKSEHTTRKKMESTGGQLQLEACRARNEERPQGREVRIVQEFNYGVGKTMVNLYKGEISSSRRNIADWLRGRSKPHRRLAREVDAIKDAIDDLRVSKVACINAASREVIRPRDDYFLDLEPNALTEEILSTHGGVAEMCSVVGTFLEARLPPRKHSTAVILLPKQRMATIRDQAPKSAVNKMGYLVGLSYQELFNDGEDTWKIAVQDKIIKGMHRNLLPLVQKALGRSTQEGTAINSDLAKSVKLVAWNKIGIEGARRKLNEWASSVAGEGFADLALMSLEKVPTGDYIASADVISAVKGLMEAMILEKLGIALRITDDGTGEPTDAASAEAAARRRVSSEITLDERGSTEGDWDGWSDDFQVYRETPDQTIREDLITMCAMSKAKRRKEMPKVYLIAGQGAIIIRTDQDLRPNLQYTSSRLLAAVLVEDPSRYVSTKDEFPLDWMIVRELLANRLVQRGVQSLRLAEVYASIGVSELKTIAGQPVRRDERYGLMAAETFLAAITRSGGRVALSEGQQGCLLKELGVNIVDGDTAVCSVADAPLCAVTSSTMVGSKLTDVVMVRGKWREYYKKALRGASQHIEPGSRIWPASQVSIAANHWVRRFDGPGSKPDRVNDLCLA